MLPSQLPRNLDCCYTQASILPEVVRFNRIGREYSHEGMESLEDLGIYYPNEDGQREDSQLQNKNLLTNLFPDEEETQVSAV